MTCSTQNLRELHGTTLFTNMRRSRLEMNAKSVFVDFVNFRMYDAREQLGPCAASRAGGTNRTRVGALRQQP